VIVSIGGGSATGLAKAIALDTGLPIIAVPTTFAGSEATPVWGITRDGRKQVGTDRVVLPATVVYDTALFRDIPSDLATASAFNALAHGVDALWAPRADPFTAADAEAGIRSIASALRRRSFADDTVTHDLLVGTYLASVAFAAAGSGMHHKICHVLGGSYDLPHAPLHTVILPHVVAYNAAADREAAAVIARAVGGDPDPVEALLDLAELVDAPNSLADLGFSGADVAAGAALCLEAIPPSNPRPVTQSALEELLRNALAGPPPTRRRPT
jgi:maleylacetate reductase